MQATRHERAAVLARRTEEPGGFVLRTKVPTEGEMAPRAGEVLQAYKEQHGVEQNGACLQDPVMLTSGLLL